MLGRVFKGRGRPPRLSIVIPVHNVETYLAECLDSVLGQEFHDLEIVLIDDGSTDGSAAIAADYARGHANVRLLQTENHGLGAARNLGARHVSGSCSPSWTPTTSCRRMRTRSWSPPSTRVDPTLLWGR
ncbi:MAG: glycosyltransferase family 2 protein [Nocardioidaceae bacterium]